MNNNSYNQGIVNSWSLIDFANSHGSLRVGTCTVHEGERAGETFPALRFTAPNGTRTFVSFSSNLGVLTPKEISERAESLQVVELQSGSYKLCNQGSDNWGEEVILAF